MGAADRGGAYFFGTVYAFKDAPYGKQFGQIFSAVEPLSGYPNNLDARPFQYCTWPQHNSWHSATHCLTANPTPNGKASIYLVKDDAWATTWKLKLRHKLAGSAPMEATMTLLATA